MNDNIERTNNRVSFAYNKNTQVYLIEKNEHSFEGISYTEYTDVDGIRQNEELEIGGTGGPFWNNCVISRKRNHRPGSRFGLPIGKTIRDRYDDSLIEEIESVLELNNKRAKKLWDYAISHSWERE